MYLCIHVGICVYVYVFFFISASVFFCACVFELIMTMCDCRSGIKDTLID